MPESQSSSAELLASEEKARFEPRPSLSAAWVDATLRLGTPPQSQSPFSSGGPSGSVEPEFSAAEAPTESAFSRAEPPAESVSAEAVPPAEAGVAVSSAAEAEFTEPVADSDQEEEFFSAPHAAPEDELEDLDGLDEPAGPLLSPEELAHARRFVPWVGGVLAGLALLGGVAIIAGAGSAVASTSAVTERVAVRSPGLAPAATEKSSPATANAASPEAEPQTIPSPAPAPETPAPAPETPAPAPETAAAPEPAQPTAIASRPLVLRRLGPVGGSRSQPAPEPAAAPPPVMAPRPAAAALPPVAPEPPPEPVVRAPGGAPPTAAFPLD